jgi:hypothetical protein
MTVTLKATAASPVILCHGADYAGQAGKFVGPLGNGVTDTPWQVQPSAGIRSATRKLFDRLNAAPEFDLSVFVEFGTEAEATSFRLSWAASLPRAGAYIEVAHSASIKQTFSPALMDRCRIEQQGVGCTVTYHWQCGSPVTS